VGEKESEGLIEELMEKLMEENERVSQRHPTAHVRRLAAGALHLRGARHLVAYTARILPRQRPLPQGPTQHKRTPSSPIAQPTRNPPDGRRPGEAQRSHSSAAAQLSA